MARKYDLISELYDSTCKTVTANSKNWEAFLRSACRNFKLRFDEQLLVYAQRPDATAVLEIERWNKKFGRWVNRGAHGIAVFEDAKQNRQRLIHYFDISDTHESDRSRPAPIWKMKPEYTESIITTLENSFGTLNSKRNLSEAIIFASMNASEDNLHDYIQDFAEMRAESNLEQFSVEKANGIYSALVTGSIAYMIMSRLEVDTSKVLPSDFFADIAHFNTPQTLNALGFAVSDIAKMGLTEIARTVLALDKENRIIVENQNGDYNIEKEINERSIYDERDQIHDAGRLQSAEPDNAGAAGSELGQIRSDEEKVSEGTSQSPLLQSSDELHSDRTLDGNRTESFDDGRNTDEADGGERRDHGESESDGYDVVGSENEQLEEPSSGDRLEGSSVRLEWYDRDHEDKSLPFFGGDDTIREILRTTPHLKASKDEIRAFFEAEPDEDKRTEYIKGIFNNDYTEVILSDDRQVGYKTYQNVLHLWNGSYLSRTRQSFYDWGVITKHFEAMRLLGELQDEIRPIPSIDGQMTLMSLLAEDKKSSAFTFSQEIIDAVLTRGSSVSEGKFRIYEQFEKSLSAKENADFLKDEYGWGGVCPVIVGTGIDEQHNGKGITISKGIGEDKLHTHLTWTQVGKRIGELIRLDRYLNPKEKAVYPEWLQKQEERRAELAEKRKNREILSTAPPEKKSEEQEGFEYNGYHFVPIGKIDRENTLQEIGNVTVSNNSLGMSVYNGSRFPYSYDEFYLAAQQPEADVFRCIETGKSYLPGTNELFEYVGEFTSLTAEKQVEPTLMSEYEYHLGDTVYMGADEYEILSFDNDHVMLFDTQFPLFQKEMNRAEFDRKVQENPMNDHLKVKELMSKQKTDEESEIRFSAIEFEKLIPYHMRFKETDVVNGSKVYWVTQGIFNAGDLRDFQRAVKEYDGNIKKFYVTSRSISSYDFEEDTASKALAIVTPDTILKDDYINAIKKAGLSEYLRSEISEEAAGERQSDDPNTTPIGDDDYYFHRPDMGEFEAIYYNPDATAGGQFVVLHIPYELIAEAKANSNALEGFYEYIDSKANTELIDVGTEEFADYLEAYAEPEPDYVGRTEETMQALISQSERASYDIGMGYLGNGLTVWNRAVEEHGDYQTIAHISYEGEIKYYVEGLPNDVVSRIEQAAEQEKQKALFTASYKIGSRVYLDGKPFEITRTDEWNVALMDRSLQNPTPRLVSKDSFVQLVQQNEYNKIKQDNPNTIVLYQVGDFFELYGNDATYMSDTFAIHLTNKMKNGERVSMCGIPSNRLETYVNMLTDRGNDVVVASLENGERITRSIVSTNKDDPVESKPIGRIDYLHTDGRVRESVEYTSPYQFEKDIKEENHYGVPMVIVLYKDKDGKTIPRKFIEDLAPLPQGLSIIWSPYLNRTLAERLVDLYKDYDFYDYQDSLEVGDTDEDAIKRMNDDLNNPNVIHSILDQLNEIKKDIHLDSGLRMELNSILHDISELNSNISLLDKAKGLIDDFVSNEYRSEEGVDYSDLTAVKLAYTTTEDEKHEIQTSVDLINFRIEKRVDNVITESEQYRDLKDLCENALSSLSFDDLVYISDDQLALINTEKDDFADVDSSAIREALAERGIVNGEVIDADKLNADPFIRQVVTDVEQNEDKSERISLMLPLQKRTKVQTFYLHPDIPMSERHTFNLAAHEIEEVGKKERFRRNIEAINVLRECQFDNRFATPEEQEILSKYVGWGGIPEAFDRNISSWADEFKELYTVLSPDEYESANSSVLTAFYTPPSVISAIYKAMEQMGFREGNILEPSCGIGNFIGMLPESMKEAKMYGVEIDKISAGIAGQLYQKTSIAAQPFEEANVPDSFFDAIVGNVPFGDIRVNDRRYNKYNFLIHDYFFAKSLDKLRPGGIMALVTSKGTMDKENSAVRKYIAQRAELLGAIRLPNNTFSKNAGAKGVVSDILFLQKRDRIIDIEPDWVHLNTDKNGFKMNSYFVDHPEMVLGKWKTVSGRYGNEDTIVPYENADLAAQLDEAISNIHAEITVYETEEELEEEDTSIPADPNVRNFSYTVVDDKIYYRENSRMTPALCSVTAENRIKGMIGIRDCVRNLIEIQTLDFHDWEIEKEQQKLNNLYDTFSHKYGLINSRANVSAFSQDSSFSLLSALEILDDEGKLERKADMFTKRTIKPHTPVTSVDTASEALALSMGEKARVDMEYMCELTGKSEEEIYQDLKGVIFLNPMHGYGDSDEAKYLMADEYLSGNVREKLAWAKRSTEVYPNDYKINVEALEKVQPADLTASEIFVQLGTTWLPEEIVQQFIYEFLDTPIVMRRNIKVHYSKFTSEWNIKGKSNDKLNVKAYSTYGTKRINAYKIIEETLNMRDVRIFDYVEDDEGRKKAILNNKETAIAQAKQELIKQGFKDWIWNDPNRREQLVRFYNDKFNSIRPREYDGSHIIFSGINPEIELREHQKNAVAHILYGGNTLLAHTVGAGKTFEMTAAAMESKRLGLCSKSLFVVPNHLTEQWAAEFLQLYPAANILVATKKDFEMKNRKRFCGRIATGDYDAVIIGHSQFEKIPMSFERQIMILQQQIRDITNGIIDLKANKGDKFSVKQLEKTKKSLTVKLEKLNDQSRKDDVVTFEELGIDRLFIDESHYYKNLYLYTKMRNVGGIAQTEAQKSSDLFMKCRYLDELTGGRGVVFATGTPISNSMVELYTIQRYLQYSTLEKHNLQHFDAWASNYGETMVVTELKPEGTGYRSKTRFARFNNLPELMAMFKEVADIKTADMLDLPVPEVEYHNIAVKPSQIQKDMVASLAERAEAIRAGGVDSRVDNMLKITNDGRKLALDQRMLNEMLPDDEGSKVNACINEVYRIWEENTDKRSTQLLFCDLSTPKGEGIFSVYTDIRKKLIERGIPESEIKFIHEADTEAKKQELFKKVRKGEVRILIGSTAKMGAGTNVQNKIIASHDIDCPWRPSDLEQRAGRTVRQGNENPKVHLYRYVTEDTFDAYLYQLVEGKQKFASQIMTSKSPVRSCEDIDETALSYAEIKMLATGNPYIKEKMDLDIQVSKLRLLKSSYLSEKYDLEGKIIKYYTEKIAEIKELISGLESDLNRASEHPKTIDDRFVGIEVQGVFFSEIVDAGQKIIEACTKMTFPDSTPLGKYRGFDLELSFDSYNEVYVIKIRGELSRSVEVSSDPSGNITRIDNAIEKISEWLEFQRQELENIEKQLATAQKEVEKPFDKEQELTEKTERLSVLNGLLNLDKKQNEIVDGEIDENEIAEPNRKSKEIER